MFQQRKAPDKHDSHTEIPVSVHVQLVAQQDDGSLRLEGFVVQSERLQVQLAAFKALHAVDAVDHQEGVGPRQIALAVPWTILHTNTHNTASEHTKAHECCIPTAKFVKLLSSHFEDSSSRGQASLKNCSVVL